MPFFTRRRTYTRITESGKTLPYKKGFRVIDNRTGNTVGYISIKEAKRIFKMTQTKRIVHQIAKRKGISYKQAKDIYNKIRKGKVPPSEAY